MNTIAYIPGVWDLLHVGHVNILESAKALCDRLVVGVAHDAIVKEDKDSFPIITHTDRARMLGALKSVDLVLIYTKLEFITHLEMIQADILIVGEWWGNDERHIDAEEWIEDHGGRLIKLPYYKRESSTAIKQRIRV